jgi:hypothetical protein
LKSNVIGRFVIGQRLHPSLQSLHFKVSLSADLQQTIFY